MADRRTYEVDMTSGETWVLEIPADWKWTLGPISPTLRKDGPKAGYERGNWTKGWMLRVYADAAKKDQRMAQGEVLAIRELSSDVVFRKKTPANTISMDPDPEDAEEIDADDPAYHIPF